MDKDEFPSSTIKISRKDLENKSIPVICSWCNAIFRISEWEVDEDTKTRPSHGICEVCKEKMKQKAKEETNQ
jgi:hypothetical protein